MKHNYTPLEALFIALIGVVIGLLLSLYWRAAQLDRQYVELKRDAPASTYNP